jgi:hypothetical protein
VEAPAMINPADIIPLPRGANSAAAVRAAVEFERHVVEHPQHEIFVLWCTFFPQNPFAVVMRISKARIRTEGWPIFVDQETRVMRIDGAGPATRRESLDTPEGNVGV